MQNDSDKANATDERPDEELKPFSSDEAAGADEVCERGMQGARALRSAIHSDAYSGNGGSALIPSRVGRLSGRGGSDEFH